MHKRTLRLLAFPMLIGAFYSCQSKKAEKHPDAATTAVIKAVDTTSTGPDAEEPLVDPNFQNFPVDFSNDTIQLPATLLTTGQFHEDEVSKDAGNIDGDVFVGC